MAPYLCEQFYSRHYNLSQRASILEVSPAMLGGNDLMFARLLCPWQNQEGGGEGIKGVCVCVCVCVCN